MNWEEYFHINSHGTENGSHTFEVTIDPSCDVYRGHFPGRPVSPGVCNIGMLRCCAEKVTGRRLRFSSIKQCRLTNLVTPSATHTLQVEIQTETTEEGAVSLKAVIRDSEKSYMELKGELVNA